MYGGHRNPGELPGGRHPHNLEVKGQPEIAIRPGSNPLRPADILREGKLGYLPGWRDAANLIIASVGLRKPEIAIRPGDNLSNHVDLRHRQGKLSNLPGWRDAPNLVAKSLGKPEVAIRPGGDPHWAAIRRGHRKFADLPAGVMRPI